MNRILAVVSVVAVLSGQHGDAQSQIPVDPIRYGPVRGNLLLPRLLSPPRPQNVGPGSPGPGDLMGGFLVGAGFGVLAGGPLSWIGYQAMKSGDQEDVGALVGVLAFGGTGYVVGSAAGVWWFGNRKHGPRSFWGPMIGSFLGGVAAGGVAAGCVDRGCESLAIPVGLLLPPVGALAGYFMAEVRGGFY